jgi:hypothetical protein
MVANRKYALPFPTGRGGAIANYQCNVTAGVAGNLRLGIYASTDKFVPGARLYDSGDISHAAGGLKAVAPGISLPPDVLVWLVVLCSGAPTLRAIPVAQAFPFFGGDPAMSTAVGYGCIDDGVYAALPDPFPAPTLLTTAPIPALALQF